MIFLGCQSLGASIAHNITALVRQKKHKYNVSVLHLSTQ